MEVAVEVEENVVKWIGLFSLPPGLGEYVIFLYSCEVFLREEMLLLKLLLMIVHIGDEDEERVNSEQHLVEE